MSAAALEAGLSKSLVTKWKSNKVEVPSPDVLKKLSTYFNIPVSELLGEEEQKEKPTVKDDGLSEDLKEIIDYIKKRPILKEAILSIKELPEEKIQMLLQVARSIR